jgi:hypothetical protein
VVRRFPWFPISAGLICFAWAFVAWLTVIPNQDILVDGIQAQSLVQDPRIVLAFPGQKHGGPIEYPATVLAEWLFPGNYFANAAVRPILAFVTGFLVASLFTRLFPTSPRWSLLAAMAVGPTIIHGLLGPEGNPVGVWWLQPNWDVAWLLVTGGALLLTNLSFSRRPVFRALLGGLLVGLGFWAHPAIILLIVPLLSLVILVTQPGILPVLLGIAGAVVGVVPAAVSYVVNAGLNTWDPSHGAFIAVDYYRSMGGSVLGLNGIPDYTFALLPFSLGLPPSQDLFSGVIQSTLMWIFVVVTVVTTVLAVIAALRNRRRLSVRGSVAAAWVIAMLTMIAFITFIDPVWIYSSGLAVLFWISVGVLPDLFGHEITGAIVTGIALLLAAASTVSHNADHLSSLPQRLDEKREEQESNMVIAQALIANGAEYVYGSYYDVVQVGYASGLQLRTITNTYNRFPLTDQEVTSGRLLAGVNTAPREVWGEQALADVMSECRAVPVQSLQGLGAYRIFDCPASVLAS